MRGFTTWAIWQERGDNDADPTNVQQHPYTGSQEDDLSLSATYCWQRDRNAAAKGRCNGGPLYIAEDSVTCPPGFPTAQQHPSASLN
jgi:hypothetical protein